MSSSSIPQPAESRPELEILVADDDEILRFTFRELIRMITGYEADVVTNGNEAVELASQRDYDLILLDSQMPELDGFEATSRIRSGRRGHSPWIVGASAEADHARALAAGMDGFLVKPVRRADLTLILDQVRARRRRRPSTGNSVLPAASVGITVRDVAPQP